LAELRVLRTAVLRSQRLDAPVAGTLARFD